MAREAVEMLEIDSVEALDGLLRELRVVGADHQVVEAKASRIALPKTVIDSVIAFANTDSGGLVLLGVDEGAGTFDVVGVDNPKEVQDTFAAKCTQLDPSVRVAVYAIAHPDGVVLAARIPSVPNRNRPCHVNGDLYGGSYIRVGDRDEQMSRTEVDDLLANRQGTDFSAKPAKEGANLDLALCKQFVGTVRPKTARNDDLSDEQLLRQYGAITAEGVPTLAGVLALGENPAGTEAAARVSYQVLPDASDPADTRFRVSDHLEGTVGQILDDAVAHLNNDLRVRVVDGADGQVRNRPDVPILAIREVLGNALIHRSFAPGMDSSAPRLAVYPRHILIMSPGSIHIDVDLSDLGHPSTLNTPRNLSLSRICSQQTTPNGARVTEMHASGIRAADRACWEVGNAPAVFGSRPARFVAVLFREPLPIAATKTAWAASGVELTDVQAKIVAFADRVRAFLQEDALSDFSQLRLDAKLVSRMFDQMNPERAAVELSNLENQGVLASKRLASRVVWELRDAPAGTTTPAAKGRKRANRQDQVAKLLGFVRDSTSESLQLSEAITLLEVSRGTAHKIITAAVEKGLLEPTSDVIHDPTRAYKLTRSGVATVSRSL